VVTAAASYQGVLPPWAANSGRQKRRYMGPCWPPATAW